MDSNDAPIPIPTAMVCLKALGSWIDDDGIREAATVIEECPAEILAVAAAMQRLATTTQEHAVDLEAEGFMFRQEEAEDRANRYNATLAVIKEIWLT